MILQFVAKTATVRNSVFHLNFNYCGFFLNEIKSLSCRISNGLSLISVCHNNLSIFQRQRLRQQYTIILSHSQVNYYYYTISQFINCVTRLTRNDYRWWWQKENDTKKTPLRDDKSLCFKFHISKTIFYRSMDISYRADNWIHKKEKNWNSFFLSLKEMISCEGYTCIFSLFTFHH